MNAMALIRQTYGVPAKRGRRVAWTYNGERREARILSAEDLRLWLRFDGQPEGNRTGPFHPTWQMEYLR